MMKIFNPLFVLTLWLSFFFTEQSIAQFGLFESTTIHIIGIDMSASITEAEKSFRKSTIQTILKDPSVKKGDKIFVLPIHAKTTTASFIASETLESSKEGRSGSIQLMNKKKALYHTIVQNMASSIGKSNQQTDIVGFFDRVKTIYEQQNGEIKLYLITDMLHESTSYTFEKMINLAKSSPDQLKNAEYGVPFFDPSIDVKIIQAAGIAGTLSPSLQADLRDMWNIWFSTRNIRCTHWDSQLY